MASHASDSQLPSTHAAQMSLMSIVDGNVPLPGLDIYRVDRSEIQNLRSNIHETADALRSQMEEHAELINLIHDLAVLSYKMNHKLDNLERLPSVSGKWTLPKKSSKLSGIKRSLTYVTAQIIRSYNLAFTLKGMLAESTAAHISVTKAGNNALSSVSLGMTALRLAEATDNSTERAIEHSPDDSASLADFDFETED